MEALVDKIHFGTDGWRAIIDEDFNPRSVARVCVAAAQVFKKQQGDLATSKLESESLSDDIGNHANTILVGYDCRRDAGRYAVLVATVLIRQGFDVVISDRYCPTPALCWTIGHDPSIIGGIMLTSSHNPAEYLGIKLRMQDGGASPKQFTDDVEACLVDELPICFDEALRNFDAAINGTPENPATAIEQAQYLHFVNIMDAYINALRLAVDKTVIGNAGLKIVLDPMFGAGRGYLSGLFKEFGAEVVEVNGGNDPSFNGLHPEPVMPWVKVGADKVAELGFDACFITDGDADRIGAIDDTGTYVSSHRILALLIGHLVENHGKTGRVVRTQAGSALLKRQCERLGLTLTTKPIGFKWIYEEMLKGDVLIGGEESGGMGIPDHVRERDGLLMALLIAELMAKTGKNLRELVDELLATLGTMEYSRRDLKLTQEQKDGFLATHVYGETARPANYQKLFDETGEELCSIEQGDGIKFNFASDAWLIVRPSGTEPLVRIYAEADSLAGVDALLDVGVALAQG